MSIEQHRTINQDGYFGITFLQLESYGANLLRETVEDIYEEEPHRWFDEASSIYNAEYSALTVEGIAVVKGAPDIALHALSAYAKAAREMDALAASIAS